MDDDGDDDVTAGPPSPTDMLLFGVILPPDSHRLNAPPSVVTVRIGVSTPSPPAVHASICNRYLGTVVDDRRIAVVVVMLVVVVSLCMQSVICGAF